MKNVTEQDLQAAVPVVQKMTRAEKLKHWASLVRAAPGPLGLYNSLERNTLEQLAMITITGTNTAFALAAADPKLREQGPLSTVADVLTTFEISTRQLHAFSCDCGGAISNAEMADRIERLA